MSISKLFVWDNSKCEIMQKMFFVVIKFEIGQIGVGHGSFIAELLWNSDISISSQKTISI